MNAPFEPVHSRFGGSIAARILRCPASVRLVDKVPAYLRRESAYAKRGTALHAAMLLLIERERSLADIVGEKINEYTVTRDDTENALRPVLDYVDTLLDQPGFEYFLEHRVNPDVPGAFGTSDLIGRISNTAYIVDYKFGQGVRVRAIYPDGDEDVLNAQAMFYAAGAHHSLRKFLAGVDTFVLVILQPQSIEPDAEMISAVAVTPAELDEFTTRFREACEEAQSPEPRLERGGHCRFCPAKPICPEHTKPLLDLAQLTIPAPAQTDYLQVLAHILTLVDAVKDIGKAAHDQAKAALHAGAVVPGYALTAGRAERNWRDTEPTAIAALESLGFSREDIVAEVMRSPKQIELRAKARGLKIPSEFIVSTRSGVSLARVENARAPVPGRDEIVRLFSALQTIRKEKIDG